VARSTSRWVIPPLEWSSSIVTVDHTSVPRPGRSSITLGSGRGGRDEPRVP
jgi:hypothetical protein